MKLSQRIFIYGGLAACWMITCIFAALHLPIGLNNDTASLLHQTQKMLKGATAYVDFVDMNPPLAYLVFSLPILFSHATGVGIALSLNLFALAVSVACLWLAWLILRHNGKSRLHAAWITGILGFVLLGASFMNQLFANSEYLMATLIMPFLVLYSPLAERQTTGLSLRVAASIAAAVGFCLKPYALVFYVAAIAFWWLYGRSFTKALSVPEFFITGLTGLIYALLVAVCFPAFFSHLLPFALEPYHLLGWAWHFKVGVMLNNLLGGYALPVWGMLIACWFFTQRRGMPLIGYLLVLLAAATGSYALSSGSYYTQYPFIIISLLLCFALSWQLISIFAVSEKSLHALAVLATLFASLGYFYARPFYDQAKWDFEMMRRDGHPLLYHRMVDETAVEVRQELSANPRFLWLGFNQWAASVLDEDRPYESVGRFDYLWPIPGIMQLRGDPATKARGDAIFIWLADSIAEDIRKKQPRVILSDISPHQHRMPTGFNAVNYLKASSNFADAMKPYATSRIIFHCGKQQQSNCAYVVYSRNDK